MGLVCIGVNITHFSSQAEKCPSFYVSGGKKVCIEHQDEVFEGDVCVGGLLFFIEYFSRCVLM